MPKAKNPSLTTYQALLEAALEIFSEQRSASRQTRGRHLARTYWNLGKALDQHLAAHGGRPAYGDQVIGRLAADLEVDQSLVYLMLRFARRLPNLELIPKLSWTHYVQIMPLKTLAEREFYERIAARGAWNVRQLKTQIRGRLWDRARQVGAAALLYEPPPDVPRLVASFGQLYTYQIKAPPAQVSIPGSLVLDHGFLQYSPLPDLPGLEDPRDGDVVTYIVEEGDGQPRFQLDRTRSRRRKLYTFPAVPVHIVDGDTLDVWVDCGFNHWMPQRLRLRGLDAPELYSQDGRRARDFVTAALENLPRLVISTHKTDLYGRYIADLRYLPGCTDPATILADGIYLNQQLLDEGLARPLVSS